MTSTGNIKMPTTERNTYDEVATQYVEMVQSRNESDFSEDPVATSFFDTIGNVENLRVLDAGCGEGYVSRVLTARGATVTGIDISQPLVEVARSKDLNNKIDFQIRNLSEPIPEFSEQFDLIASNFVLNDVPDYIGFINTLCEMLKPNGRAVFALNNPYSAVGRAKAENYFDSGTSVLYGGMAEAGVKVFYYHRTLEEYITVFRDNGLLLRTLIDIKPTQKMIDANHPRATWHKFPPLMVLEFVKP